MRPAKSGGPGRGGRDVFAEITEDTASRFWVFPAGRNWRLAEPKGRLSEKKYQRPREKVPKTSPLEDQKLMAVIH
jgi:hypothetical protein